MNLEYSLEQRQLRDSAERFLAQRYAWAQRRAIAASATRFDRDIWQAMANFGWLALGLPESDDGLGGTAVDVGIVMEAMGRALVLEPYASTVVVAGPLLAALANAELRQRWLQPLAAGACVAVLAHQEPGRSPWARAVDTTAVPTAQGWVLQGTKAMVLDAPSADVLLVSAAIAATTGSPPDRTELFLVPADAPGLRLDRFELLDATLAATVHLDRLLLPETACLGVGNNPHNGTPVDAHPLIERAVDRAVAAHCAEAVGCMQTLLDATVDYARTRRQFGRALSDNQVLRHRMVDMAVHTEESRAMALRAALVCDAADRSGAARARGVSGAKLKIAESARRVAEAAVQLHGAMGVTDELNVGAYVKRLLRLEMAWGTPAEHLARSLALRQPALEHQPQD